MSDDMNAMMADGLLNTVRECARHLYGENQIYPCDDVKRMAAENERLRAALWDIHAVCNNWDWFIWMWPIRRIKRLARAALEERT